MRFRKKFYFLLFIFLMGATMDVLAETIQADANNYTTYLSDLKPGDTLLLSSGQYKDLLNIRDLSGTAQQPIVIRGVDTTVVFVGKSCCNTVSLIRSSFIHLLNFKIDGKNIPHIDAIKAEGHAGNWTHDIVIVGVIIIGHGATQQTTGISTKCPSWNWIIRNCEIREAGTGIYLGNSDGEDPFVNGLIEFNVISNTIGYNLQIKRQNSNSRNIPGMVLNGHTIIRHNVFSKNKNASSGNSARPNLLVGHFPPEGEGRDDVYYIYGNFLWQNPHESLFQGTGNIAFYHNIGLNDQGGFGCTFQPHFGFAPRRLWVFNNTMINPNQWGIRLFDVNENYEQYVSGNLVLSDHATPLRVVGQGASMVQMTDNVTDDFVNDQKYVNQLSSQLDELDLYPSTGTLLMDTELDTINYVGFPDYRIDFNGSVKNWLYRGAYDGEGQNKGWMPAVMRKELIKMTTSTWIEKQDDKWMVYPNPTSDILYLIGDDPEVEAQIFDGHGQLVRTTLLRKKIDVSDLSTGFYFLTFTRVGERRFIKFVKL